MNVKKNIEVKQIRKRNFDKLFKLFSELLKTQFPEYSKKSIEWMLSNSRAFSEKRMRSVVEDNSRLTFGAYNGNKILGFVYGEPPFGGVSYVVWLGVDPIFQRKGIGRTLLNHWEKIAKDLGAHVIQLRSDERNLGFYKKLGYKIVGFDEKSYFGADDYILKKLIQEPKEENFLRE